jgi:hypothetical protein
MEYSGQKQEEIIERKKKKLEKIIKSTTATVAFKGKLLPKEKMLFRCIGL